MTKIQLQTLLQDVRYNTEKSKESLRNLRVEDTLGYIIREHIRTTNSILESILQHLEEKA